MGSWLEKLGRREAVAQQRVQELRERIAELTEQLGTEERLFSRLQVTRETMIEIVGAANDLDVPVGSGGAGVDSPLPEPGSGNGSPIGVMLVPLRGPETKVSVLPEDYQDVLDVLVDAGRSRTRTLGSRSPESVLTDVRRIYVP
ncbi:hypothetical protein ACIRRA_43945 [Nocardia sp. NPDC101769]|uniref:hypothetical protein n=1 Tax=Nocardia sp. NPDC101769 TaxID=3364333 RepID=UPI00382B3082